MIFNERYQTIKIKMNTAKFDLKKNILKSKNIL